MLGETSEDKAQVPSGMKGIAEGIENLLAEGSASPEKKKEVPAEGEKEPCVTCDEAQKEVTKALGPRLFIVDKETGQEIPAVFKSGGKEHIPDTADKLLTWAGMGIHANRQLEEVKEVKAFVDVLKKAQAEGRLIIKDESDSPSGTEKVKTDKLEDETLTDPAVISLRKDLRTVQEENKELRKTVDSLKNFVLHTKTSEMKKEIEDEIEKFSKTYPLGKRRAESVWKLLAELNDEGAPAYTVEEAMKKVHEGTLSDLKGYIKEHPELVEKDKISQEAIAQYLTEKEENEKHPVSSPSGSPVVTGGRKPEEMKGVKDIAPRIKEFLASSQEAGKKV